MTNSRGFTLLEVIIAVMILAFLSVFTMNAIQRAAKDKAKTQKEIDKRAMVRDALKVMERDINLAFHWRDVDVDLYNRASKVRDEMISKGAPPKEPTPKKPERKPSTQFIGEPQSIDLTTLSNVRLTADSPISSQSEVGYKLKSCRRRSNQEQSSNCLWRRVSNYIHDDDITRNGEETVLLENVTEFSLRYLGPDKDGEWQDTWISNERGDDSTKGKFPYAVEITIEVKDPTPEAKDKTLRMTAVASIRNPNNPHKANKDATTEVPPP